MIQPLAWRQKHPDTHPYAFLSSVYKEHRDLRSRIFEIGQRMGRFVYVDEEVWERDLSIEDPLLISDYLIRKVREAEIVICILGGRRHGDSIRIVDRNSSVSFLEIELFQAALLEKPIYLFVLEGFDPEPPLASILELLEFALPRWSVQEGLSESVVEDRISRLLNSHKRPKGSSIHPGTRSVISKLVQSLYYTRGGLNLGNVDRDVLFLNGRTRGQNTAPDNELIVRALQTVNEQQDEELRLSRLWFAIRELMKSTSPATNDPQTLVHWNRVLGLWASSAAWYGLHGHLYMGSLAALNSMARTRKTLSRTAEKTVAPQELRYPGGQLASAHYSIAKRLYDGDSRQKLLKRALDDANLDLEGANDVMGNTLSVRAAVYGALGDKSQAVEDYEEVLRRRESAKAGPGPMGVALSNLGFAYVVQGRLWKGRGLIEQGVELLNANFRTGFLARAKRKLAMAYLLTGRPVRAYEELQEARRIAKRHGSFAQI